jgi:hypothetical protein
MSTPQRNRARYLSVDPSTADVLREEAKKVLEFNHDHFEDLRDLGVEAQHALSLRFQDAFDVINAVGWDPDRVATAEAVDVPLTDEHIEQLRQRRYDLALTNADRLDGLAADDQIDPDTLAEITTDRLAAQALDRVFRDFARTAEPLAGQASD